MQTLTKSNNIVSQLRQINSELLEKKTDLLAFKNQAIATYVINQLDYSIGSYSSAKTGMGFSLANEADSIGIVLDGLSIDEAQLREVIDIIRQYGAQEKVTLMSLADNSLEDLTLGAIEQILLQFSYLKLLDLRRNKISLENVRRVESQLRALEGITAVLAVRTEQPTAASYGSLYEARSGAQVRLRVDLRGQAPIKTPSQPEAPKVVRFRTPPSKPQSVTSDAPKRSQRPLGNPSWQN